MDRKDLGQPKGFERRSERRRERKRLRGLRRVRRKRWLRRILLTLWYVLLVVAAVSTVYQLRGGL